jgi:hypothetical protein
VIATNIIYGIIAGLISTCLMTLFEIPFWKFWGINGIFEWHENQVLASKIKRKLGKEENSTVGYTEILALHIINGVIASTIFPFIYLFLNTMLFTNDYRISIGFGILYAIILWVITLLPIHKPITGLSVWSHPLGRGPLIVSFCGHIVYGISLGTFIGALL